jgi:uncharacterized protein YcfJ
MKTLKITLAAVLIAVAGAAGASGNKDRHYDQFGRQDLFEYARVIDVQPLYREVEVSRPVRECWDEPVYQTRRSEPKSASGMLAGGIIGGIVGHQIGKGNGQRVATAVGTLIGARIGHDAVNGHDTHRPQQELVGYEEHCKTRYQSSYEEVLDAYDVTYEYRGRTYRMQMPYDPGERIKMRIQITPVI